MGEPSRDNDQQPCPANLRHSSDTPGSAIDRCVDHWSHGDTSNRSIGVRSKWRRPTSLNEPKLSIKLWRCEVVVHFGWRKLLACEIGPQKRQARSLPHGVVPQTVPLPNCSSPPCGPILRRCSTPRAAPATHKAAVFGCAESPYPALHCGSVLTCFSERLSKRVSNDVRLACLNNRNQSLAN